MEGSNASYFMLFLFSSYSEQLSGRDGSSEQSSKFAFYLRFFLCLFIS